MTLGLRHHLATAMRTVDPLYALAGKCALGALTATTAPQLSILIFHRVQAQEDPLFPLEVNAQRFDRVMALVAANFRVLPLLQAVQAIEKGRLPPRALSITFDDGYADNHDVALPILQRHGLSACFFIATGFLNGGRMFNDTVIESVRQSRLRSVDLADLGLGRFPLETPGQRSIAIAHILSTVKYLPPDARPQGLARLQHLLQTAHLPDDLMMTTAQVQAMHAAGMEIGAHTVRHPILNAVDDAAAEQEILGSRSTLQQMIDAPVPLFAYPNGQPDRDYAQKHAAMVRRLGFRAAVSTAPGVARGGADLYQLPRFTPWDRMPGQWLARLVASRRQTAYNLACSDASGCAPASTSATHSHPP